MSNEKKRDRCDRFVPCVCLERLRDSPRRCARGGLVSPFGKPCPFGEESWRGAEIARHDAESERRIAGGKQVEFVKVDIPDVNAAKSEAERLINREGLKLLTGTYSSSLCLAASEVAARAGIIYFEQGGIADLITARGYKTLLRTCPKAQYFSTVPGPILRGLDRPADRQETR